jgi:general secretion pathway protein J
MKHPASRSEAGFTVLELLVSLAILAIVLSFLPSTLRLGQRVWESDARFIQREGTAAFQHAIAIRLEQTMPIFIRDPAGGLRLDFDGKPDSVAFVAPSASGPAGGGVYRFTLWAPEGHGLTLRQTLYRQASGEAARLPSTDHVAPAKVKAMSLRYFGQAKAGETAGWQDEWPRQDALPDLVEISIHASGAPASQRAVVALRLKPPAD